MSFSFDKFLRPITGTDRNLKIYEDGGNVRYIINPFHVKHLNVSNNILKLSLESDRNILIPFSTNNEAKIALGKLQSVLDSLQEKVPFMIDKDILNYVTAHIQIGPTGSAGTSGTSGVSKIYTGTSSTYLVIPAAPTQSYSGSLLTVQTQPYLGFVPGQTIVVYKDFPTNYLIDDYFEGDEPIYMIADIDSYGYQSGLLTFIPSMCKNPGATSSFWYINLTGQVGETGTSGTSGSSGTSGAKGEQGIQGIQGNTGDNGLPGTSGTSGSDGTSGSSGTSGAKGEQGIQGIQGDTGDNGQPGSSGTSGESGSSGTSGIDGTSGTSGVDGTSGTSGISRFYLTSIYGLVNYTLGIQSVNVDADRAYSAGDYIIVFYDSSNYMVSKVNSYNILTGFLQFDSVKVIGGGIIDGTHTVNLTGYPASNGSSGTSGTSGESGTSGTSGESGTSGTSGESGTSGTSGITPSTDLTLSGYLTVSGLTTITTATEIVMTEPGATASTVVYDASSSLIWYHGTASSNYTANFINLPTTDNRAITTNIIISQGSTGYSPTSVQIEGVSKTVKWANGTYSVSSNKIDVVGFTFVRTGATWSQILGQISSFS